MADPVTMLAAAATAVSAGGKAVSAIGKFQQSRRNAALAEQSAEHERAKASVEAENRSRLADRSVGAAIARAGASGFTLSGSASDVIAQMRAEGSQGVSSILHDGLVRGRNLDQRAKDERSAGTLGLIGDSLGIAGTLLTGGSKFSQAKGP